MSQININLGHGGNFLSRAVFPIVKKCVRIQHVFVNEKAYNTMMQAKVQLFLFMTNQIKMTHLVA
jgi:hypothetical protein